MQCLNQKSSRIIVEADSNCDRSLEISENVNNEGSLIIMENHDFVRRFPLFASSSIQNESSNELNNDYKHISQ